MIVYFTTVVRCAPQEHGGELVKIDWATKKVLARTPIAPSNPPVADPNPRGSTRGGRGVLINNGRVFAASYHSLLVFDHQLNQLDQVSSPLFANLHEVCWDGADIWATSTDLDAAVKVDLTGKQLDSWWPREDSVTVQAFSLPGHDIDKNADNRTNHVGCNTHAPGHVHINAVATDSGRPLIVLNRFGCVVRLNPTEIVVRDDRLRGCHNVLPTKSGLLIVNDTVGKAVMVYDLKGKFLRRIHLLDFPAVKKIYRRHLLANLGAWLAANGRPSRICYKLFNRFSIARPIFVRGLCEADQGSVLVGISPATILQIDPHAGRLIDYFQYSRNRHDCVHGLSACQSPGK